MSTLDYHILPRGLWTIRSFCFNLHCYTYMELTLVFMHLKTINMEILDEKSKILPMKFFFGFI